MDPNQFGILLHCHVGVSSPIADVTEVDPLRKSYVVDKAKTAVVSKEVRGDLRCAQPKGAYVHCAYHRRYVLGKYN